MKSLNQQLIDGDFVESYGRDVYAVTSARTGAQPAEAFHGEERTNTSRLILTTE